LELREIARINDIIVTALIKHDIANVGREFLVKERQRGVGMRQVLLYCLAEINMSSKRIFGAMLVNIRSVLSVMRVALFDTFPTATSLII